MSRANSSWFGRVGKLTLPAVAGLLAVAAWDITVRLSDTVGVLPSPWAVTAKLLDLAREGEYYRSIAATLQLTISGLSVGVIAGILLGGFTSLAKPVRAAIFPYVHALRALPAVALIPVALALFPGEAGRPFLIGLSCSAIIATSLDDGLQAVTRERLDFAATAGLSGWRLVVFLYVPEVARELLVGVRIASGLALILAVVLEMLIGAPRGLGVYISTHSDTDRATAYAAIVTLGLIGVGLNGVLSGISRRLVYWER